MSNGQTHVQPGRMFGAYRVEERIGAGGMGEVFRAVDTRLDRRVAIKVCAERFSTRFEQEARAISALNHPHICTLYDVGPDYLVMELLEGSTLSSRIAQGPIPIDEMLQYGVQLANALAEAHAAGIVHRDLKPGNVMVTRHGIKILDFGLAKMIGSDMQTMTRTGVIAGTPAYIAPEQLAGHEATPRSDLFALGLVLYEMAAGRPAVPGGSLGNILFSGGTPVSPPSSVRAGIPPKLDALVDRLLAADPSQRPASAAAVANELRAIAAPPARTNRTAVGISIAAVLGAVVAGAVWWQTRSSIDAPLQVGEVTTISVSPGAKRDLAYSPDGSSLAFSWPGDKGDAPGLYVMHGQNKPVRLASTTANDVSPAWSPDGKQLAFLRVNPGLTNELMVLTIADAERGEGTSVTRVRELRQPEWLTRAARPVLAWMPDGRALAVPLADPDNGLASLFRVDLDGSAPRRLVASRTGQGITAPAFSRDGRWLVFSDSDSAAGIQTANVRQLYVAAVAANGSIAPRQPVPGSRGGSSPSFSPDGRRLIWMATNQIMEWSRGEPEPRSAYRLTNDGFQSLTVTWTSDTLPRVAFSNLGERIELRQLPIEDGGRRAGAATGLLSDVVVPGNPGFSPDGRWFSWAAFNASLAPEIWIAPASGGEPRRVASIASGAPITWSRDSRHLTFHARPPAFAQAFILDIDEQGVSSQPRQVTNTPYDMFGPVFSPDGKWLLITSVRDPILHRVVRVPSAGGQIEDLFEGRSQQVSADGRTILYAKPNQRGLWQRSLEGDVSANAETRLIEDYVAPLGYVPGKDGVFYVGRTPSGQPDKIRFFDYASRKSFDLGPAPLLAGGNVFLLGLSPDNRRLVYQTAVQLAPAVTAIAFRR